MFTLINNGVHLATNFIRLLAAVHIFKIRAFWLTAILCCLYLSSSAQYFAVDSNRKNVNIPFRLIRNMVVIKMQINNKGPFNFVLDTGVGLMIMTDPTMVDSINLSQKRTIKITGLGEDGDYEAFVTSPLKLEIPGLYSIGVSSAILKKDYFNLSSYVGVPIHGLIGWDFFNNLAVKINFSDSTMTVCRPKDLKGTKKSQKIPITIEDKKPYLETLVTFPDGRKAINKLVIDLGAGHPLSLENLQKTNGLPKSYIRANLGVALNGPISGFISRINELELGKYKVKNVITSFPDVATEARTYSVPRDGNLGIGILKKFNVIFDYSNNALYLKPNLTYDEPFEHDMSGIEYYSAGENLDHLIVSRVEQNSPADEIGLQRNDEIVSINFKPVSKMSIEEVDNLLKSRTDRSLLLEVYHDKLYDRVILTLRRRI
ncbi:PDZ domain-containing protein [Mucilaginibacter gilvus]|uniref:Peptide-binding protein n=1 Tax=Mucilaginibacter gilvus TaxID=2305909 RepID=A0A444MNY2_9SPHI|nr:PDZ domain-containing protein [Mucilaginibacter gilvus]RWY52339.1 peptide-binding protein [Mucilaginibacter gilvus]